MRRRCLALVAMVAGCSSSSGGSVTISNNGCALPPSGVFLVHMVEGPGNTCGPIADSLIDGSDVVSSSVCPGGTGTITDTLTDGGGCSVVVDVHGCKVSNNTGSYTDDFVEKATWSSDYSTASGIESVTIATGSQQCSGTYMVTFTRQ